MTPRQRGLRLVDRQLEQLQDHRLILAEHFAGGDAEEEGVADLAGGAGDGDADGCFHEQAPGGEEGRAGAALRAWIAAQQRRACEAPCPPRDGAGRRDAAL